MPGSNGTVDEEQYVILNSSVKASLAGRIRKTAVGDGVRPCSAASVVSCFVEYVYAKLSPEEIEVLLQDARARKRRARQNGG